MAHKLGYISDRLFHNYIHRDEFKEAKRYCVSFLARENEMVYYDNREIDRIICDTRVLKQIYENIRHELYNTIEKLKNLAPNWINYNIDGISVKKSEMLPICNFLDENKIIYKVNECIKIDNIEYYFKGKIRKF